MKEGEGRRDQQRATQLHTIRLELGRTRDFPQGTPDCGYEFVAPLNAEGHLDFEAFQQLKSHCRVHRFWVGELAQSGALLRLGRDHWVFSYEPGVDDDEPAFKFERHQFRPGEYVSITDHNGETLPFRIVSVEPFNP
ncbi:hypothetical protein ACFPL7_19295 [Dongia soli]|uniref:Uncharacterized protein n=1 Tax=Dongia soli TaxID=600628 RepID=A0ABU5E6A5_9PROT|nr:hypothetical protein [Dongia soli]MDY0881738.1 hypothetical protein [Dongia soli]